MPEQRFTQEILPLPEKTRYVATDFVVADISSLKSDLISLNPLRAFSSHQSWSPAKLGQGLFCFMKSAPNGGAGRWRQEETRARNKIKSHAVVDQL